MCNLSNNKRLYSTKKWSVYVYSVKPPQQAQKHLKHELTAQNYSWKRRWDLQKPEKMNRRLVLLHLTMWLGLLTRLAANKYTIWCLMRALDLLKCFFVMRIFLLNLFDFDTHIWSEEELNAIYGSFQSQSSDQEDCKNYIWQRRRHINSL